MPDAQLIATRVIQLISEEAHDFPVDRITVEKGLQTDLGLDSIDRLNLVVAIEEEFDTALTDQAEAAITNPAATVAEVLAAVLRQTQPRAGVAG